MITTSLLWVVVSSCVLQLMTGAVELHGPCPMPSKGEDESALTDLGSATATPAILIMKITRASRTSLACARPIRASSPRSEEHTSELQSRGHLVCRLLLEKKKPKSR